MNRMMISYDCNLYVAPSASLRTHLILYPCTSSPRPPSSQRRTLSGLVRIFFPHVTNSYTAVAPPKTTTSAPPHISESQTPMTTSPLLLLPEGSCQLLARNRPGPSPVQASPRVTKSPRPLPTWRCRSSANDTPTLQHPRLTLYSFEAENKKGSKNYELIRLGLSKPPFYFYFCPFEFQN